MKNLIICGAGGFAKSIIDSLPAHQYNIVGFIDEYRYPAVKEHMGYPIMGNSLDVLTNPEKYSYFICIGDNEARKKYFEELRSKKLEIISIIDKTALVSSKARIGEGCFIGKLAVVNSMAKLGDNTVLNTRSLVEHGCILGNHVNISTNTVLNGDVHIGDGTFVGSCAVVNGQLEIGEWTTIGSGSVVVKNIGSHVTAAGIPAHVIKGESHSPKTYIIAEIGCNHNGDYSLAEKMVRAAKECGVDAVKFQTFHADKLISKYAPKAEYQKVTTGEADSQLEMTRRLELPQDDYLKLKVLAESLGLDVFSTPFDMDSIDFLAEHGQKVWKIPSGEVNNLPYLEKIAAIPREGKHIILSTGMATVEEIHQALCILEDSADCITLLHCNTEYPTPDGDVNVSAIGDLQSHFPDVELGLSDHSVGDVAAVMAIGYGAKYIEKHFTLDKDMPGPDHKASATPEELKQLVHNVRRAEAMLGSGRKHVTESERRNMVVARRSIVAAKKIKAGDIFSEENISCKRPGNGVSPMRWHDIMGKCAKHDYAEDELISMDELEDA